jgi:hypothetical protein
MGSRNLNDDQMGLRLAILSTPRSGNTWVRGLLAALYDLEQISGHLPDEIDWENLPRRCVIQIHWYPWPKFRARLERLRIRPVALARHPLDVLLSWLNYAYYVHLEGYCQGGGVCKECAIVGAPPRSETFLDYAGGEPGRLLLCYTPAWWDRPGVLRARYEELVAEPDATLGRLVGQIDEPTRKSIAEVIESTSIRRLKPSHEVWHYHYWQGQPGLWRAMLPPAEARAIAAANPEPFETLGYACDPDEALDGAQADLNWLRVQLDSTREHLVLERAKRRKKAKDFAALEEELKQAREALREGQQRTDAEASRLQAAHGLHADPCRYPPGATLEGGGQLAQNPLG